MKIAIVGSGIAGLTAAYHLSRRHEIAVFEKHDYAGGHSNTISVTDGARELGLDTGFIVYNERTYPAFTALLAELGVETHASEMSFGVACRRCAIEYSGSGPRGLFARPSQILRPPHLRMLLEILRFNREGIAATASAGHDPRTLGEYLRDGRFSDTLARHYVLPMGGAIWSADMRTFETFPARYFLGFFHNHGLLTLNDHPQWRTVRGGSRSYVRAITRRFASRIRLSTPVRSIRRHAGFVEIATERGGTEPFDRVVIAAHSDQALRLLADPTDAERAALGAIRYQPNEAILHTDDRVLPRARAAWASWNVSLEDCAARNAPLVMTYLLNRLQRVPSNTRYCVTLNDDSGIAPGRILRRIAYDHPVHTHETLAAQQTIQRLNGERLTHYCGAYLGYGFHEDGVRAGLEVARAIDAERAAA